jgi:hypothetical protein
LRVLQEPVGILHWGVNTDIKHFLTNAAMHNMIKELGEDYDEFTRNLDICGMGGLEPFQGMTIIIVYITGYETKGSKSSAEWDQTLRNLEDEVMEADPNLSMALLIGKEIHVIAKSSDFLKDGSLFASSGGRFYFNDAVVKSCSLNCIALEDLVDKNTDQGISGNEVVSYGRLSWTYDPFMKRYETREDWFGENLTTGQVYMAQGSP